MTMIEPRPGGVCRAGPTFLRLAAGPQEVPRKVVVVAQQGVELGPAPGLAVAGPTEQLQAEADGRRVQREQLLLEPEGLMLAQHPGVRKPLGRCPEEILEHLGRAMGVRVGEGRPGTRTLPGRLG
jgi:hypothetical protein